MAGYPVSCYGMTFTKGAELHDWVDSLYSKPTLSSTERNALYYLYDGGLLAHPDYKHLSKKPAQEPRPNGQ